MTDTPQVGTRSWTWPLIGICCCCVIIPLTVWSAYESTVSRSEAVDLGGDAEEEAGTEETAAPVEASGTTVAAVSANSSQPVGSNSELAADAKIPPLGEIKILVPARKFKKEGRNRALRVSFEDIDIEKVLNTKKLSVDLPGKMPDWLRNLNGQRVRMKGYMHPASAFTEDGIKRFTFCRDTGACCFGPDPTIFYLIETTMKSGTSTRYVENKAFDVEGIFRIEPIQVGKTDRIAEFYHLDDAVIVSGGR